MALRVRRDPLLDLRVRLGLVFELLPLLHDWPPIATLTSFLDGDNDRRLTDFYNSKLDPGVRHAIDATRQAVSHLQHLDPQISLATFPCLISRLGVGPPAKVTVIRHESAPPVVPRPSLPADVRNRHLRIGKAIASALEPLVQLLPQSARQIWRRHRPAANVRLEGSSKRDLKRARRVAYPLKAMIEKWMRPIAETLTEAAALLAVPKEELMAIDEIARIPERLNGSQDAFAMPVFLDGRTVDVNSMSIVHFECSSRRFRLRCHDSRSRLCRN